MFDYFTNCGHTVWSDNELYVFQNENMKFAYSRFAQDLIICSISAITCDNPILYMWWKQVCHFVLFRVKLKDIDICSQCCHHFFPLKPLGSLIKIQYFWPKISFFKQISNKESVFGEVCIYHFCIQEKPCQPIMASLVLHWLIWKQHHTMARNIFFPSSRLDIEYKLSIMNTLYWLVSNNLVSVIYCFVYMQLWVNS